MRFPGSLTAALLAAVVAAGSVAPALAAGAHSHDAGATELTLNHGRKWPTDEALRKAMSDIRASIATSLEGIHKDTLSAATYERLATVIEAQVDHAVKNCKLPDDADAQLHIVLAQLMEGAEGMRGTGRRAAAVKVVTALDTYGKHFDHTGWKPLVH